MGIHDAKKADRRFAELSESFICVKRENRRISSSEIIFHGADGREIDRLKVPYAQGSARLEAILAKVREVEQATEGGRTDLAAYALTIQVITPQARQEVEAEVRRLGDDAYEVRERATEALVRAGYPAHAVLPEMRSGDPEVRWRIDAVLKKLRPLHERTEARGLDHDVEFLAEWAAREDAGLRERARRRLESILPEEARGSLDGWRENRDRFTWDRKRQRFVPRE